LTAEDLQRVAASCPALRTLDIDHLLAHSPGEVFTPLLLFTSCRKLWVGGPEFDDRAAPIVAQLTQLTHLECECSRDHDAKCLTRVGLAKLTALTGLQELHTTDKYNVSVKHSVMLEYTPSGRPFIRGLALPVPWNIVASKQVSYWWVCQRLRSNESMLQPIARGK
jgi:hypothetical protein